MNTSNTSAFLDTAARIGSEIAGDALWDGDRCNWLGGTFDKVWWTADLTPVHRMLRADLYEGTSGLALLFARLYLATRERPYRKLAEGAMRQALSCPHNLGSDMDLGFYTGYAGIGYAGVVVGEILERDDWVQAGLKLVEDHVFDQQTGKRWLDVTSGIAGVIPLLVLLHRRQGTDRYLEWAKMLGDQLVERADKGEHGWSWNALNNPPNSRSPNLLGLSHGAAGFAWAFGELYQATRMPRFREAMENALRYERHWFNPTQRNWPDFRGMAEVTEHNAARIPCQVAWCTGAPGVVLSRLRLYALFRDAALGEEADLGLQTIAQTYQALLHGGANGPARETYCLCHGHGGNCDPLLVDFAVRGNWQHRWMAEQIGRMGIEAHVARNRPWKSGTGEAGHTPGLMVGTAGVAYYYLRLHDPISNPSMLILDTQAGDGDCVVDQDQPSEPETQPNRRGNRPPVPTTGRSTRSSAPVAR